MGSNSMSSSVFVDTSSLTSPHASSKTDGAARSATSTVAGWEMLWNKLRGPLPPQMQEAILVSSACISQSSPYASAFDLKFYAEKRLAEVMVGGHAEPTSEALHGFRNVLNVFVADNGPTPQVGPTQSGSVEIQWLAGGTLVAALFDKSGDYNVCAMDPSGDVIFDRDIDAGESLPEDLESSMRAVLSDMKVHVKMRPASWF